MILKSQADEIIRLSNMLAMKRVRHYAARQGTAGPRETIKLTESHSRAARTALHAYVGSLVQGESVTQFEGDSNG